MSQFVREFLSLNPSGWTRAELKELYGRTFCSGHSSSAIRLPFRR